MARRFTSKRPAMAVGAVHAQLFSTAFINRAELEVFRCGNYRLSLHKLAKDLDYPFPMSARLLNTILKINEVHNLRSLFDLGLGGLAQLRGVGDSLCAVATIILADAGFNLAEFCGWSEEETPVRFQTLKSNSKATETSRKKKYEKADARVPSDFTVAEHIASTH